MIKLIYILLLFLLVSCGATKNLPPPQSSVKDSTRVETKVVTVFIRDTVTLTIPGQTAKNATRDSSSHLETDYAVSDASVDSTGTLHHTLSNKDGEVPMQTNTKVIYRDSLVFRDREVEVPTPYPVEVKVPRDLTFWQQMQMKGFWLMLVLLLLKCRKGIFAIVRRFI